MKHNICLPTSCAWEMYDYDWTEAEFQKPLHALEPA